MARGDDRDPVDLQAHNALLIEQHLDFVRLIAKAEVARWGPRFSLEDAVQYGVEGLLIADQRFDAAKGVAFRTYAERIISGHIRDGAAKMSDGRRRLSTLPYDADADDVASLSGQRVRNTPDQEPWEVDLRRHDLDVRTLYQGWRCLDDAAEVQGVLLSHVRQVLLPALDEEERRIIEHHFFEERQFQELAGELGVVKATISRRYAKALVRLRKLARARPAPR